MGFMDLVGEGPLADGCLSSLDGGCVGVGSVLVRAPETCVIADVYAKASSVQEARSSVF